MPTPQLLPTRRLSRSEALQSLWPRSELELGYDPPSKDERHKHARLISLIFSLSSRHDPQRLEAQELADELELQIAEWKIGKERFWALTELPRHRRGVGAYLIRIARNKWPNVLLQVPHAYFELRLQEVGLDLLLSSDGRYFNALFTNSLHRHQSEPGLREPGEDSAADAAHDADHWFQAATEAILGGLRRPIVVQLHGFADAAADTNENTYAIISGGNRNEPTPLAEAFAFELREQFGRGALLFPVDTDRLGGTLNVQGQAVLGRAHGAFLHVELGRRFRERIADDDQEARRFRVALWAAISSEAEAR